MRFVMVNVPVIKDEDATVVTSHRQDSFIKEENSQQDRHNMLTKEKYFAILFKFIQIFTCQHDDQDEFDEFVQLELGQSEGQTC